MKGTSGFPFFGTKQIVMKHLIFVLFAAVMFSGCVTQRRCLVKFPPDTITKIETTHSIEYRDTTIFRTIPGDSVFVFDTIRLPISGTPLTIPPLTARLSLAHSTAWVDNNRLNLGLWIDSTTLQFKLDSAKATVTDTVRIHTTDIIQVPAPIPKRYTIAIWALAGGVVVLLLLALVFFKMK